MLLRLKTCGGLSMAVLGYEIPVVPINFVDMTEHPVHLRQGSLLRRGHQNARRIRNRLNKFEMPYCEQAMRHRANRAPILASNIHLGIDNQAGDVLAGGVILHSGFGCVDAKSSP